MFSYAARYFVASEMVVVCCSDPDVAVTVTVDCELPEISVPPPQPFSVSTPTALTTSSSISSTRRRFFQPNRPSAAASTDPGSNGPGFLGRAASENKLAVEMLSVVDAGPLDGVTVFGEKAQVAPAGSPEQPKDTCELKPPTGTIEIVVVPLNPDVTVIDVGEAETEKSAAIKLMVYAADATELFA